MAGVRAEWKLGPGAAATPAFQPSRRCPPLRFLYWEATAIFGTKPHQAKVGAPKYPGSRSTATSLVGRLYRNRRGPAEHMVPRREGLCRSVLRGCLKSLKPVPVG